MPSASSGSSTQNLLTRGLFTLVSVEVEPIKGAYTDVIVSINYTYGNSSINLKGNCPLPDPEANFVPISTITRSQVLDWLVAYCPESTDSLDARLAALTSYPTNTKYIWQVPSRSTGSGSSSSQK